MLPSKKKQALELSFMMKGMASNGLNKYNNNHRDIPNFVKFFWWLKYIVLTPNK